MTNDVTVQLHHSGAWHDITPDVRQSEDIAISWGTKDEATAAAPLTLGLTLDNRDGTYTPRNPASPLFGLIGRNTPVRVRLGDPDVKVALPGVQEAYLSAPATPDLDITGDIDIRIDIDPVTWRPADLVGLARKYQTDLNRAWGLQLNTDGTIFFRWSTDGDFPANDHFSTAAVPESSGRLAVRVTLEVDNGAGRHAVRFYTAPTLAGPWSPLGGGILPLGVTSVFASTAPLEVGRATAPPALPGLPGLPFEGTLYGFELRDGIDGTIVATLAEIEAGYTESRDSALNTWTVHYPAVVTDPSIRAAAEVSSWPTGWDLSGTDVSAPIEGSGILRRLGQGAKPLRSSLYRDLSRDANVVAYWPLEDGNTATRFASGLSGDTSTLGPVGEVDPAAFNDFVASDPIPTCGLGRIDGDVPAYAGVNDQRLMFLVAVPEGGVEGDRILCQASTFGTIATWQIRLNAAGNLAVRGNDANDALVFDSGFFTFEINGKLCMISLWLNQNAATCNWQLSRFEVGQPTGNAVTSGWPTTYTRFRRVQVGTTGGTSGANGTAFGHVAILNGDVHSIWDAVHNSLVAWTGETALERVERLCAEEGVPLRTEGTGSQLVGPQRGTFLEILTEAAEADLAFLGDDRDAVRLFYRTGRSLENQTPALTLDYSAGDVAPALEPTDDDQFTRNDVTVKRPGGSSANATAQTGPMSVDAVGRYDTEIEVNVEDDGQLHDQAGWRLHLGTVDEARYPQVAVDLAAAPELTSAATAVYAGDRIHVTNPPAWLPPGTIDQIVRGGAETLSPYRHTITYNTTPASPWTVSVLGEIDRVDTDGTLLGVPFDVGTDTAMVVAVVEGPLWTTDPAQFPLQITAGGVVLTVTGISSAGGTTQVFTVGLVPVNGVVKTIPAGSDVRLAQPAIAGI